MTGAPGPAAAPRRFYRQVGVGEGDGGHAVHLDGRPVMTPGRVPLAVPDAALAEDIAGEWRAQGTEIRAETMPLTRIANSAIDQVARARVAVIDDIAGYAACDLVCYRAEAPAELVVLQARHWDPVLDWAMTSLDARFELARGVIHAEQPAPSLAAVRAALEPRDPFALAALHVATTLTGSALLALALAARGLDADSVWAAAHVDEDWQISQWGEDSEAAARRAARHREFAAAARLLELRAGT